MRHALTAVALSAATLVTAACAGSEDPSPPPTPEAALSTAGATSLPDETERTTTQPSPDESTSTSLGDGPPELPPEATEQTYAGATAAFAHFIDTYNYSVQGPTSGLLPQLTVPSCAVCVEWEEKVVALEADGDRYTSEILSIDSFAPSMVDETVSGTVTLSEMYPEVVSADGSVLLESSEPQTFKRQVELVYIQGSWIVQAVLTLDS